MAVALVTDSTADLDPETAAALGIDVVPLFVNFGSDSFRDRIDITREEFYRRLAGEGQLPTTSQASTAAYAGVFQRRIDAGDEIVCLSISSRLSGTINAAVAAAAQFQGASIQIVDSRTVSGGLWLLLFAALEIARSGASSAEVAACVEEMRSRQSLFAAIPDLSHAVRTGRISKAMAMIGGVMKILPIIGLDEEGKVVERGRVRTFERALDALLESTVALVQSSNDARIAVVHARAPQTAELMRARLAAALPHARIDAFETGPAIAVHAGIGAVGVFSLWR